MFDVTGAPRANDREWIQATLLRFEAPLILYAAKICGGIEPARDAVQDTFLELCSSDRRALEDHLAAWLFTVCRNKALDLKRRNETMRTESEVAAVERASVELDPSAVLMRGEDRAEVLALVARLPEKQQEVLRLKFHGGLSYKEIAGVTGDSIGNVGFLLHVALRSLRDRLAAGRVERGSGQREGQVAS